MYVCVSDGACVCRSAAVCVCGGRGAECLPYSRGSICLLARCILDFFFFFFFSSRRVFFLSSLTKPFSHHDAVSPPGKEASKERRKDPPPSGSSQAFRWLSGVFGFVLFCFLLRLQTRLMITSNNLLLIVVLCLERHFPQTRAVSVS